MTRTQDYDLNNWPDTPADLEVGDVVIAETDSFRRQVTVAVLRKGNNNVYVTL